MKRRMILGAGALAGVAAALGSASVAEAGCGATAPPVGSGSYGSGDISSWSANTRVASPAADIEAADVWLFGDSITVDGWAAFRDSLLATNGLKLAVEAWAGRPTPPTVDALESWLATYPSPRALVMATGTNDIYGAAPTYGPPTMATSVNRVMAAVAPTTKVIWVDCHISRWCKDLNTQVNDMRNTGYVNTYLWNFLSVYPGDRYTVVGWAKYLAQKPARINMYLSDGVHTTTYGRDARNELTRQAVARMLGA